MSPAQPVRRRSDAVANRAALLDAAELVLLRDGPAVPLDVVAREAGVGIATLYRNFADREELYAAVVHRSYELVAALAQEAEDSAAPPLAALAGFLRGLLAERHHLALPLLGAPGPLLLADEADPLGSRISRSLAAVLKRGVGDGSIRPDATTADLVVTGAMLAQAQLPSDAWGRAARRIAALVLDGLRARPDTVPLPDGLTGTELDRVMTRGAGEAAAY
ncbi:TetR/AcrR family transcriptional regulator [Streptomyces iranensis]|uniref:AcrR family transcriptional regulator n=1 Tax=Streptomyces iranensis TaxID=576784 RepID=A0A060ZQS6_9ACTN|nr:TetR/AcrR family transcriptional regulator [Streptomyces iranensis]MBP2068263.1 AcrR family transcriptional regulator [Streptomyces iranensis]CDR05721.1 regulatory protein TetR [Streptomyces iranensis]